MTFHKILIDDFMSSDYELLGIHSNLEDFRLAFFLNQELNIKLQKLNLDIELQTKNTKSAFHHFLYDNEESDTCWHLVGNKAGRSIQNNKNYGFFDSVSVTEYLIPEYKKTDFFLKIENIDTTFDLQTIKQKISSLHQVTLLYTIDQDKLKSKNNLIF